jgi:hypothetical protein
MPSAFRQRRAATAGGPDDSAARSARPGLRARGAWAAGSFLVTIARLLRLVVGIVVAIIVAAILLRVLDANASNTIVRDIHDVGRALVGPFANIFNVHDAKAAMAVNWGLAALVYLIVGGFIAGVIARGAPGRAR